MSKKVKKIIHLSLFPNSNCHVCGVKVKEGHIHCEKCCDKWIEGKENSDK